MIAYYGSAPPRKRRPVGPKPWRNTPVKTAKPIRLKHKPAELLDAPALDEYGEGFIDGYLRAHEDGDEYACSVKRALYEYQRYLSAGGRGIERTDVEGW